MSGLAGLVHLDGRAIDPAEPGRMADSTPFRGRDGVALWYDGPAALIRFKHATTPQAVDEVQPLQGGPAGAVICFDGRLDNRREIQEGLPDAPGLHDTAPDCAFVLALFERHGDACVAHLAGDYAFAIWQPGVRRMFCARSPLGWRPLLWYGDSRLFAFASDARALVRGLRIPARLNEAAVGEYLAMQFAHPTDTFWQGIQRLEPGSSLSLEDGRVEVRRWFEGPFPDLSGVPEPELIGRFRSLFDQAIVACMRSSTPVAAHLSGGLDSSSVVCRAVELFRAGRVDGLVRPISARFPGALHDETEWSRSVERHLGVEARPVGADPYSWDWAGEWCARTSHLPPRPNVMGPLVSTCRRASADGCAVMLTGEGGDDWMGGSYAHWPDLLRQGRLLELVQEGMALGGRSGWLRKLLTTASASAGPWISRRRRRQVLLPFYDASCAVPDWIEPAWARRIGLAERWRSYEPSFHLPTFAQQSRFARYGMARHHVSWETLLAYSESEGVELRHPMHDLRLTKLLVGVPGSLLRRDGEQKHILREAMRGTLPERVRTRKDKAYFVAPIVEAMRAVLTEGNAGQLLCVKMGWVKGEQLWPVLQAHHAWLENGADLGAVPRSNLGLVWSALSVDLWLRRVVAP